MKKSLLLTALTAFGLGSYAQTFVSTTPENRNVVLEEYTGIYCGFCPSGHAIANSIKENNPGDVVLVNVHVGGFAAPNAGDPDFRTSFGTALDNAAGTCGYPGGSVNRQAFPGLLQTDNNGDPCGAVTAMGRGNWANAAGQVLDDPSPVNVAGQATLDLSTRTLTVVSEVYYTGDANNSTNKLTIAVLQNGVIGPQSGASGNPDAVNPDGTYTHGHMLRHFMTGQWGETISQTSTGSFFTHTEEWVVPADINGVPLDLNNLEVALYVAEGNQDIISGSMAEVTVVSPNAYDALPAGIEVPEFICENEVSPVVTIQNMGNEAMTSLDILYSVNGGPAMTYNWTGSLATAQTEEVTLPTMTFTHLSENTVWVATNAPNGQGDQVSGNDVATATFEPSKNSGTQIDIEINTDNWGHELYWEIQDASGATVASGGNTNVGLNGGGLGNNCGSAAGDPGAYGNSTTVNESVTLTGTGCHTFILVDCYGDGLLQGGTYTISSNNAELYEGGSFAAVDEKVFNVGGTNSVNDLELVNNVSVYPNPFQDNATVSFNMVETGEVSLEVVNVLGAKVFAQNLGEKATGAHNYNLSAENLPAGIYMVNLVVNDAIYSTRVNISK